MLSSSQLARLSGLRLTQAGQDAVEYLADSASRQVERYGPADDVVKIADATVEDVRCLLQFVYGGKLLFAIQDDGRAGLKFVEIQFASGLWVSITSWKDEPGCTMMLGHTDCPADEYARLRDVRETRPARKMYTRGRGLRDMLEDIYGVPVMGEPVA